jgi:hypothetical protein
MNVSLFIVMLALLEAIVRLPPVIDALPAPSRDFGYRRIEEQFAGLEHLEREAGHVDCIFIGSSVVQYAFDTRIFEQAYAAQSGEAITCYNFGMWWARADAEAAIARMLIQEFQPKLLIWGVIPRDLEPASEDIPEVLLVREIPQTDWIRYVNGDVSTRGWLLHHSAAYRYLRAYSDMLRETHTPYFENVESRIVYGYQPAVYSPANLPPVEPNDVVSYVQSPEQVQHVRDITLLDGHPTRVMLLEMPIHATMINMLFGRIEAYRQVYHESLRYQTFDTQAMLWATDTLVFDDADFADGFHLWATGSMRFSEWLGYQLGEAHNRGLFGDVVPEDLRFNPPLDMEVPPANDTITTEDFAPGLILDPRQIESEYLTPARQMNLMLRWATHIDEQPITDEHRNHLQEFLAVLNQSARQDQLPLNEAQSLALQAWRGNLQASHLHEAGIDYVLVPSDWYRQLTSAQQTPFTDPAQYHLIDKWWHPVREEEFELYQVVG